MRVKTFFHTLIFITFLNGMPAHSLAADQSSWELTQKVKIIKYLLESVTWPKEEIKNNEIHLCVLGEFENLAPLKEMNGTLIKENKVIFKQLSNFKEYNNCQLIYIAKSEPDTNNQIIKYFVNKPILTLSDTDQFALDGGGMNFVVVNGFVALTVNIETIKNSHLLFDLKKYRQITVIPTAKELKEINK